MDLSPFFPQGRQVTNLFDLLYRRTQIQETSGGANIARWEFFGQGRVAEVHLGNGLICTWMNNARTRSAVQAGQASPAWGNQLTDRLGYDGAGRPITKRFLAGGIHETTRAYNLTLAEVGFTTAYDHASNKLYERHLHAESRSHLYEPFVDGAAGGGYDSVDRLRQYQRGVLAEGGGSVVAAISLPNTDQSRSYDLDGLGNWRRTAYTPVGDDETLEIRQHNGLNQITRREVDAEKTPFSYDGVSGASNGNLADDGVRLYQWDALNRLLEVKRKSDSEIIGQYAYDATGRRIRKTILNGGLSGTIPNGTIDCLYSGWRCIEERDGSNATTKQFIWGIYLDELIQQKNIAALNNFAANSIFYPLQDLLYRTHALSDSSGILREAYDYDAYGNTLIFRNTGTPPGQIQFTDADTQVDFPTCDFLFTGQRLDGDSVLYFYKGRFYIPVIGRFISRDRFVPSIGAYGYARDVPTTTLDPSGWIPGCALVVAPESGCETCGPDVSQWFLKEVKLFSGAARKYLVEPEWGLAPGSTEGAAWGTEAGTFVHYRAAMQHLSRLADYKYQTFDSALCPVSFNCAKTVTLFGGCVPTNQLGNIIYGVLASIFGLVDAAREYGHGNPAWYMKLVLAPGPVVTWLVKPEKETAFNLGLALENTDDALWDLVIEQEMSMCRPPNASIGTGYFNCSPCRHEYVGPNTDMTRQPLTDPGGN